MSDYFVYVCEHEIGVLEIRGDTAYKTFQDVSHFLDIKFGPLKWEGAEAWGVNSSSDAIKKVIFELGRYAEQKGCICTGAIFFNRDESIIWNSSDSIEFIKHGNFIINRKNNTMNHD